MDFQKIVYFLIGLFIGMILHEYMHGRVADWRGDHTARNAGRLTLNPIPHIDPFGTILVPLALILLTRGGFAFGYAKPVPVNPYFLKKPRRDMMMVALAGPLTNFALATAVALFTMILRLIFNLHFAQVADKLTCLNGQVWADLFLLFASVAVINVVLGIFNLIPVPPLDGSHVLEYFLPPKAKQAYESVARFGFIIILVFLVLLGGYFFSWMQPIFNLIDRVVFGSVVFTF